MSNPVRPQDRQHFSIVQESLVCDGLHVAMVARDRKRRQDYAGTLARALASHPDLRIEAYNASRLESVIVDLMLHRFDAALSDISTPTASHGRHTIAGRPGCVLFITEAHALPRAEFHQLLRIAACTHKNGLRLVALFDADSPACDGRIAEMGTQVARWDLDDASDHDLGRASPPWRGLSKADGNLAVVPNAGSKSSTQRLIWHLPRQITGHGGRWIAAASAAAMLALIPAAIPKFGNGPMLAHTENLENRAITRSGTVELAGVPQQAYTRAPAEANKLTAAVDFQSKDGNDHGSDLDASPDIDSAPTANIHAHRPTVTPRSEPTQR